MRMPTSPPANPGASTPSGIKGSAFLGLVDAADAHANYRPWDSFRNRTPAGAADVDTWWAATRWKRRTNSRELPLTGPSGEPLTYALPDEVLELTDRLARRLSGLGEPAAEVLADDPLRARYRVSSLMEEAIGSSTLDGVVTDRDNAKAALAGGHPVETLGEQVVANTYATVARICSRLSGDLTPEALRAVNRALTTGTKDTSTGGGRLRDDDSPAPPVIGPGEPLDIAPPPASASADRMAALCAFLTGEGPYIHPILRALTAHYVIAQDRYFVGGNGRTARAIASWYLFHEGYRLTEFVAVSRVLAERPAAYVRSFVHTHDDAGDLTHFFLIHLRVWHQALDRFEQWLERQTQRADKIARSVEGAKGLNARMLDIVRRAHADPEAVFDVRLYARLYDVSEESGRRDLLLLDQRGYLERDKDGRRRIWRAAPGLGTRVRAEVAHDAASSSAAANENARLETPTVQDPAAETGDSPEAKKAAKKVVKTQKGGKKARKT